MKIEYKKTMRQNEGLYTVTDVAERFGCTYRKLGYLISIGFIPEPRRRWKNPKRKFYNEEDIELIRDKLQIEEACN